MIKSFLPSATVFTSNGERIIQAIKCIEHRELGDWYIDLVAPLEYQAYLEKDYILVVPTKEKGDQPFRINNPKITDKVDVRAYHIGFDARNYAVELSTVVNGNAQTCLNTLSTNIDGTHPFTFTSAISTLKSFSVVDSSLYNALIQIAEEYNGILDFNGWNITISSSIGADNGVVLAYGKNIQESEINENWDLVVTKLKPIGNDGILLTPAWLTADVTYDRPYTKIMNFDTDDVSNLGLVAQLYLDRYKVPRVNYKVKADVEQNVALGDAVTVNARQFTTTAEVLSFDYNPLINRVIQVEFGNFRPTLKQFFSDMVQDTEEKAVKRAQVKIDAVNGEISAVVSDVADLGGQVSYNSAQLVIQAGDIATKVSTTDLNSTLTNYSTITQTANKVALEVGNVQIGGVNLVVNGKVDISGSSYPFASRTLVKQLEGGKIYTFTVRAVLNSEAVANGYHLACFLSDSIWTWSSALTFHTGNFETKSVTFTMPFTTTVVFGAYFVPANASPGYAYVDWVKVEEGNKATDFSYALNEMRTAKYVFDGSKARFYGDGQEWYDNSGNLKVSFDTVNNRFVFKGQVEADTGLIGRFAISGQDLVYTSDLFNKEYDYGDLSKLSRILAELDTPTAYESEVYDVNRDGLIDILDLVQVSNHVKSGTALPTPRRQIRSVIRIGTTSGELRTTAVSALGNTGNTFVMKADKLTGDMLNVKVVSAEQVIVGGSSLIEKGTWTPVNEFRSGQIGTWSTYMGEYTKIGNVVVVTLAITGTGMGYNNTGGHTKFTGLPYPVKDGASGSWVGGSVSLAIGGITLGIRSELWFVSPQAIGSITSALWATMTYLTN
ncbi:MAG: phage-like [Erysipelotrichaceae bacterium]|nr:MAG: phage-like [Erysipelotrichaceae bacterium]